jgi:hypothetical protein
MKRAALPLAVLGILLFPACGPAATTGDEADAGDEAVADAGGIPDAGVEPDAGPPPPPDAGPPPPPPDAGPPDAGGVPAEIDCTTTSVVETLIADTFDEITPTEDLLSTDTPGELWTKVGDPFDTRQNGTGALIIEGTNDVQQPTVRLYAGASTPMTSMGAVGSSTYRLRTILRPGETDGVDGNDVRFLFQAGNENPPAFLGMGMELNAQSPGILRIVDQENNTNRIIESTTLASVLTDTGVYAMELCFTQGGAKLSIRNGDYDGTLIESIETGYNLIPNADANPIFRIEGHSLLTNSKNIEISEVELVRMQ